jgi:hypothetical protein
MRLAMVWCLAFALLPACASSGFMPLDRPALRASQPRTLAVVKVATPRFAAETSEGQLIAAFFGPVGAATAAVASVSSGEALARDNRIADPAIDVGWALAQSLMRKYSLEFVKTPGRWSPGATVEDLADTFGSADLVLEIGTSDWGFRPTGLGRYGVTYDGTVRLVDTRKRAVVAEGVCASHPLDSRDAPSHEQLLANDGAALKDLMRSTKEFCLRDYRTRIFGLYDSPSTGTP